MIKAIFFDLDGTLIDTNELIITSFQHVFKNGLNIEVSKEEIIKTFGSPLSDVLGKYFPDNVEEIVNEYVKYSLSIHDEYTKSFDGIEEGLISLRKKGIKLAVVTSKRRNTALRGLELFNLTKYFDVIVSPEDTEKHKPNGEPVMKACELLQVKPEEVIMVGDSHNDILCGKNANAKTCLVSYSLLPIEETMAYGADYLIDNIEELIDYLD